MNRVLLLLRRNVGVCLGCADLLPSLPVTISFSFGEAPLFSVKTWLLLSTPDTTGVRSSFVPLRGTVMGKIVSTPNPYVKVDVLSLLYQGQGFKVACH